MTIGRSAGVKTCDDCRKWYAGPAYYTFQRDTCVTVSGEHVVGRVGPGELASIHVGCTENLCPGCAGPYLEPDRADDPRRPKGETRG